MLKLFATLVLALAPGFVSAEHPEENETAMRAKMLELAGPGALQCGLVERKAALAAAWQCAREAEESAKPFWLAVIGHRTDSAVWHLIARDRSGKRYVIFYTSNNSGQPEFEPHFGVIACNEPFHLVEDSLFRLRCGPDVP
jgi:hypothetical protein